MQRDVATAMTCYLQIPRRLGKSVGETLCNLLLFKNRISGEWSF